jgi:hypothetical protein
VAAAGGSGGDASATPPAASIPPLPPSPAGRTARTRRKTSGCGGRARTRPGSQRWGGEGRAGAARWGERGLEVRGGVGREGGCCPVGSALSGTGAVSGTESTVPQGWCWLLLLALPSTRSSPRPPPHRRRWRCASSTTREGLAVRLVRAWRRLLLSPLAGMQRACCRCIAACRALQTSHPAPRPWLSSTARACACSAVGVGAWRWGQVLSRARCKSAVG